MRAVGNSDCNPFSKEHRCGTPEGVCVCLIQTTIVRKGERETRIYPKINRRYTQLFRGANLGSAVAVWFWRYN